MRYLSILVLSAACATVWAGEARVLGAEFEPIGDAWDVRVTVEHDDTGWDHYADAWRIVDGQGQVIATRNLAHPHVEEQPFTRGLSAVELPETGTVYIEAHDNVHGWGERFPVEIDQL